MPLNRLLSFYSLLQQNSIEAYLVSSPYNVFYLTGFRGLAPFERESFVLRIKEKTFLITSSNYESDARNAKDVEVVIPRSGQNFYQCIIELLKQHEARTLHFETRDIKHVEFKYLQDLSPILGLSAHPGLVETLRAVKDNAEIEFITKASKIANTVLSKVQNALTTNHPLVTTESSIAWLIEQTARENGAESVVFPPIVGFKEHSAQGHHASSDTVISNGPLMVDFGVQYKGYVTDVTRMFYSSKKSDLVSQTYSCLLSVQQEIIEYIQIGMTGKEVFDYAVTLLKKEKLDETFNHTLGHGVGLQIHENPRLASFANQTLEENMVFTIEPGVYYPGKFGMRIEDTVVLTKTGCTILTSFPKNLALKN